MESCGGWEGWEQRQDEKCTWMAEMKIDIMAAVEMGRVMGSAIWMDGRVDIRRRYWSLYGLTWWCTSKVRLHLSFVQIVLYLL